MDMRIFQTIGLEATSITTMLSKIYILVFLMFLKNLVINADVIEDMKKQYVSILMKCAVENSVDPNDLQRLAKKEVPTKENAKCLLSCAFKATGMMDDKGMLSVEGVNKLSQELYKDDADKLKKAAELLEKCKAVNDEKVNDGAKGCDRAAAIFKCTNEFGLF